MGKTRHIYKLVIGFYKGKADYKRTGRTGSGQYIPLSAKIKDFIDRHYYSDGMLMVYHIMQSICRWGVMVDGRYQREYLLSVRYVTYLCVYVN